MTRYYTTINEVTDTDFVKTVQAGSKSFTLHFVWDEASEEQWDILYRGLKDRASSDPLITDELATINRDYDWIDYMLSLPANTALEEALEAGMEYPQSIRNLSISGKVNQLIEWRDEAEELEKVRDAWDRCRYWHCTIITEVGEEFTCDVVPGGYMHNQSSEWKFQFMSDLERIGKDDLTKMTIYAEVEEDEE